MHLQSLIETIKLKGSYFFSQQNKIVIVDDIFPHLLSGFRVAEFNYYLNQLKGIRIYSTTTAFPLIGESGGFEKVKDEYGKYYPLHLNRINKYNKQLLKTKLLYFVFLNNAFNFLPIIEKSKAPFIFTLYPGGGFRLNDQESDKKLKEVLSSQYLYKVIVTSKAAYDYLINNHFCKKEAIECVYGVVVPPELLNSAGNQKKVFGKNKTTLDICFVAHKYMQQGKDKGYDIFIEVAKKLSILHNHIMFHVVGNFDETDVEIAMLDGRIKFYNTLKTHEFPKFYSNIDIILSPNSSFVLAPGAFDGFPTGACIEAGLNGVALFVTDDLDQNVFFENNTEIVIVPKNVSAIADLIEYYNQNPDELYYIAQKGKLRIQHEYHTDRQMIPRLQLLKSALSSQ